MEQNSSERWGRSRSEVARDDAIAAFDSDGLLRTVLGDATDGIVATDATGTVALANASVGDALGYAPTDLVGAPVTKLFDGGEDDPASEDDSESEDDPAALVRRLASETERVERLGRQQDGSAVPLSVSFREHECDGTTLFVGVLRDISERKRTDERLRRRGEAIERLQRLDALVRGATRGLVRAESKADIDRVVADQLVETELFAFATVGTVDASDWSVTPTASAGGESDHESGASARLADAVVCSDEESGPVERAVRTGETQVVADASGDLPGEWGEAPLASGHGSVAVVPLGTDAARSGVAVAYRATAGDLTEREQAVLDDLGEFVGYAVHATECAAALESDAVVQLKFEIPEFGAATNGVVAADDWEFQLERTVRTADRVLQYGTVTNARPEPFVAALESLSQVENARHVASYDDEHLLEVRYANTPLLSSLAEYGGRICRATATAGSCRVVIEVPSTLDVRSVVQTVRGEYSSASLVAQRTTDRETTTYADIEAAFADRLTDRQQTAIEVAYLAGYFEWPRESSAEDVADSLGIGPSTFTEHLRAAERKLFAALLGGESAG